MVVVVLMLDRVIFWERLFCLFRVLYVFFFSVG